MILLLCKKSMKLSIDSEIIEGCLYKVSRHGHWKPAYIQGEGINGYSWIEIDIDRDDFKNIYNYFYTQEEHRNLILESLDV